jgi:hypothetical protein
MPSHGDREMPVWGRQFLEQDVKVYGPSGGEIVTTERIHNLAGYLETLQQKIPAAAKFANGFLYVYGWIGAGSEAPTPGSGFAMIAACPRSDERLGRNSRQAASGAVSFW